VTEAPEHESLQEQILSGENRNLQLLAAQGLLPLPPEELLPLQVGLATGDDEEIATAASDSLGELDPRIIAPILAHGASEAVLTFFAERADHPLILETIIRLQEVPLSLLIGLAKRVPAEQQEILILRQDAILEEPRILDALDQNQGLSASVRRRIKEYREHLFPRERPAISVIQADPEDPEVTQEFVDRAFEEALLEPIVGEIDEQTGLSEGQIRTLPIPVRLLLSRGASKTVRDILIRDRNPQVAVSVLTSNSFSDGEIERVANLRTVVEEVLDAIGRSRQWMRKYPIAHALVRNPRTPIPLAVRLVPRLAVRDLRVLRKDRNVSEAVRQTANRLYLQKMK
jgi:hypothetical protein